MVSSPLLAFMFDPVFHHHDLIKSKSSDERFGRSRTDSYRTYTGQPLQGLHQASAPVLPDKIFPDKGYIGGLFLSQLHRPIYYGHPFQIQNPVVLIALSGILYSGTVGIHYEKPS